MSERHAIELSVSESETTAPRVVSPAAERALAEARARREAARAAELPPERNGRSGPEPTRFGDWEKNGIVSDF